MTLETSLPNGQPSHILQVETDEPTSTRDIGSAKRTWLLRVGLFGFGCFALGLASTCLVLPRASHADQLHPAQHVRSVAFAIPRVVPMTRLAPKAFLHSATANRAPFGHPSFSRPHSPAKLLLAPSNRARARPAGLSMSTAAGVNFHAEPWMDELGRNTNSKKKWAVPMDPKTLGPGSIVMAEPGNFDHYFLESLVLILEHNDKGTKGVLLNHGTPWMVEDLAPSAGLGPFAGSNVFLGGDAGRDTLVMVHGEDKLPGAIEVGKGVYKGGVDAAKAAVEAGALPTDRFKFFYKSVEWLPDALSFEISRDTFRVVSLSPAWLLGQNGDRSLWQAVSKSIENAEKTTGEVEESAEDITVKIAEQDVKIKAVVAQIKKDNAAKAQEGGGEAAVPRAAENVPMPMDAQRRQERWSRAMERWSDGVETEKAGVTSKQRVRGISGAAAALEAAKRLAAQEQV